MCKTVWVVSGDSESSDHYGPLVFSDEPSEETYKEIAHSWDGDEDEDGCGDFGSYVYLQVDEVEVDGELCKFLTHLLKK